MPAYKLSDQARKEIYYMRQKGMGWPEIRSNLRKKGLIQDMPWQHLSESYEANKFVPTKDPGRYQDFSSVYESPDLGIYNPGQVEKFEETYTDWAKGFDEHVASKKKAYEEGPITSTSGFIPPNILNYTGGKTKEELLAEAQEAEMYKGQIPEGSMYIDGALISPQDYAKEQEEKKKVAYAQFPWMEQLETLQQPAQQPVQQQPVQPAQQPMGNIAPNMPMFGQISEAKAPTTEGGVSRSYSAIGGSQFQPNDRKSQQPKYGGQNTGYEGTIAPSVNKLFGR